MFTQNIISLSKLLANSKDIDLDVEIIRDFNISFVGKIPTNLNNRLVSVSNAANLNELKKVDGVAGVLTTREMLDQIPESLGLAICPTPYAKIMDIHEYLISIPNFQWRDFPAQIGKNTKIHPSAVIPDQNVRIGENCVIGPNAVICERVIMGDSCSIGPGSIIGCDAFDLKSGSKIQRLLQQSGGVIMGNHVTILASTTIVRASFGGFTVIEDEASFDNLVHVAHDCHIGKRSKLAACAEVSGRVNIGSDCFLGPNVTISNGINIGNKAHISLGSVVVKDVESETRVTGNFALPHLKWLKFIKSIR